ncbi:MAG: carbonic anhydrase [Bacteroidetes bacterium]|nr:carbonic anhydrase [Bacteroidota bacterium]
MDVHKRLILQNKAWAEEQQEKNPELFKELASGQHPKFLWIGCSDSRVPVNEITDTHSGDIFVHRNIANMVVHTDLNLLSVLQYAVEVLKVEHIIVCGHYGCGGVKAAFEHNNLGLLNKWLRNIKDVYRTHKSEIEAVDGEENRINRFIELNAEEQAINLSKTSIVQQAWANGQKLMLHGWVFDIATGLVHDRKLIENDSELDEIYKYDLESGVKY